MEVKDMPEVVLPILSEAEMIKLKEEVRKEIKAEREAKMSALRDKLQYRVPITKFAVADIVGKVVSNAKSMGVILPKDVQIAMGLQKGQLLKIRVELFPEDAAKLFSNL